MILDKFKLNGKVALVTGASSGLGQAVAIALAEAGADVACHARSEGKANETIEAITNLGGRAVTVAGDMADRTTPSRIVAETIENFGRIDILINNAGMIRRSPAVDYSEDDWSTVLDVNLSSVFRLSQAAGREMIKQGSGKIVNIASLLSFQGGITVPAYTASKSGVAGLTKALANEWAKSNVNVNAIAPGVFRTALNTKLLDETPRGQEFLTRTPMGRFGNVEELAGAAVFLASEAASFVTGEILVVDGGFLASGVNQ